MKNPRCKYPRFFTKIVKISAVLDSDLTIPSCSTKFVVSLETDLSEIKSFIVFQIAYYL